MASPKNSPPSPSPAPVIGKIGPYTVFLTPTPTPTPIPSQPPSPPPTNPVLHHPPSPATPHPPPVLPPPVQYAKPEDDDRFGFISNAIAKVQHVHSSVDEYVANWLGLNKSRYQWALDEYYQTKDLGNGDVKPNDASSKTQCV